MTPHHGPPEFPTQSSRADGVAIQPTLKKKQLRPEKKGPAQILKTNLVQILTTRSVQIQMKNSVQIWTKISVQILAKNLRLMKKNPVLAPPTWCARCRVSEHGHRE